MCAHPISFLLYLYSFSPFSRYLLLVKTQFGDEAEMLVEEILRQGQDIASRVIIRAAARLKDTLKGISGKKSVQMKAT